MDGFTVGKQDNSKIASTCFGYPSPSSYPAVRLLLLPDRLRDGAFNPFDADISPVLSLMGMKEVLGEFHVARPVPISSLSVRVYPTDCYFVEPCGDFGWNNRLNKKTADYLLSRLAATTIGEGRGSHFNTKAACRIALSFQHIRSDMPA